VGDVVEAGAVPGQVEMVVMVVLASIREAGQFKTP
jgi:hypothetical protein